MSEPEAGNHADLYGSGHSVDEIVMQLEKAGINCDGLFNNADAGFDECPSERHFADTALLLTCALIQETVG